MSNIEFSGPRLYPVIHNEHVEKTVRDTEKVLNAGADGVFLINRVNNANSLLTRFNAISKEFPEAAIGLNFSEMRNPFDVYTFLNSSGVAPYAVWTDWYLLDSEQMECLNLLTPTQNTRKSKLFAGVSHKAASYIEDPFLSAQMAVMADGNVDYVTTTGPGTGLPAPTEKLTAMRHAVKYAKLAVTSGVSAENVGNIVPLVDAILVASSLESYFGEIDDDRLRMFMNAFRHSIEQERQRRQEQACSHEQVAPEPIDQLHLDFGFNAGW